MTDSPLRPLAVEDPAALLARYEPGPPQPQRLCLKIEVEELYREGLPGDADPHPTLLKPFGGRPPVLMWTPSWVTSLGAP